MIEKVKRVKIFFLLLAFLMIFIMGAKKKDKEPVRPQTTTTTVYVEVIPNIKQADMFVAECTAYTAGYESTCKNLGDEGYGITSSGKKVGVGYVAADIRILPYGSLIYIEGMGVYEVQDTGGAIKGNKIDIYYENLQDALNFGRQWRNVIVLHKS